VDALSEKKGENIILLDVHDITSFTDYFIICNGTSNRMLKALADGILEKTKDEFKKKNRLQGSGEAGWIVLDYGDIVVHLFDEELRKYYNLEELWKEGKIVLRFQ
jgi:ribosome-associated protein